MRWGRAGVTGLALVSIGCASGPNPTPASATPIPSEPCDAEMVGPALARLPDVEGYRFRGVLEHEQLRRPTNLNNPVFEMVSDRTIGAFLAPARLREELDGNVPEETFFGYDARITIDDRSWLFYRTDGRWQEVSVDFGQNPANDLNVIIGEEPWPFEVLDEVDGLPGEGGCVLTSERGDARSNVTVSIRLDPALGRIVAWQFERDQSPEPGDSIRQSMLIEYDIPASSEIQPPSTFEPLAPVP
jgi:hypothetical protein